MAKKMIYSVYDSKVKYFHPPMFMMNKGEALRSWEEVANAQDQIIARHPQDFALFELGEFDDQNGAITMHKTPESLGIAAQFKRESSTPPALFNTKTSQ